jgi:hypothetical protein
MRPRPRLADTERSSRHARCASVGPVTAVEHRTTTEPCPRCTRMRPALSPQQTAATIAWDVVRHSGGGRSGRPVGLCCPNGHDTDDSASLWMWLGERPF